MSVSRRTLLAAPALPMLVAVMALTGFLNGPMDVALFTLQEQRLRVLLIQRANKPTLLIQGTTDLQVTVEDAKLLNKARRTTLKLIDGMNHILKEAPIDRATNLATYADPSLPLAPKLVSRITDFIEDND